MGGGFGDSETGVEKDERGKAGVTEDVPGDLNKESLCTLLR